jgi:hypothetical protein
MKPSHRLALITEGALSYTPLARLKGLSWIVGQVKAPTFRLSSRIANSLRGPNPVRGLSEMAGATYYLLCTRVTDEILGLHDDWSGRTVWIARFGCDSRDLAALEQRGAATASLTVLDYVDGQHFLAEGSEEGVSSAVKVFASTGARVISAPRGAQPWFEAARILGGAGLAANLQAASDCLRSAGLPLEAARSLVRHMVLRSLRSHLNAGYKAWKQPAAGELDRALEALESQCPALHQFLRETAAASAALHRRRPAQGFGLGGGKSRAGHTD